MRKKLKKLLLVALVTALSITQFNIICQAKLKPGQFNKEMLKWLEPYKERDDIPDSWTWYPEYNREENNGDLPENARIRYEKDGAFKKLVVDRYWLKNVIWGGAREKVTDEDLGETTDRFFILNCASKHSEIDRVLPKSFRKIFSGGRVNDGDYRESETSIVRVVSKDVQTFFGNRQIAILLVLEGNGEYVNRVKIYHVLNTENYPYYDITDQVFSSGLSDFSRESLRLVLDKFSTMCYNYFSYIGSSPCQIVHPSTDLNYSSDEVEDPQNLIYNDLEKEYALKVGMTYELAAMIQYGRLYRK